MDLEGTVLSEMSQVEKRQTLYAESKKKKPHRYYNLPGSVGNTFQDLK